MLAHLAAHVDAHDIIMAASGMKQNNLMLQSIHQSNLRHYVISQRRQPAGQFGRGRNGIILLCAK